MNPRVLFGYFLNLAKLVGYCLAMIGAGFSISFCGIGIGIYVVAVALDVVLLRNKDYPAFPHNKIFLLLIGALLISVLISHHQKESLRGFWKYLEGFILLYASVDVLRNWKKIRFILYLWSAIFSAAILDALVQKLRGTDLIFGREALLYAANSPLVRIRGPYNHSNDFSSFMLMGLGIFIALGLLNFIEKKFVRSLAGVVGLFGLLCVIYWTMSRGAVLGVVAVAVCFILLSGSKKWSVLAGGGFLISFFLLLPHETIRRFSVLFDITRDSNAERIVLAKTALRMIGHSPIFGLGLNTWSKYFADFKPADFVGGYSAHNAYLQMTAECGLVGLFFFVLFVLILLKDCFLKIRSEAGVSRIILLGVLCSMAGFLVASLFDSTLQSTQLRTTFWLFIGLAYAVSQAPADARK